MTGVSHDLSLDIGGVALPLDAHGGAEGFFASDGQDGHLEQSRLAELLVLGNVRVEGLVHVHPRLEPAGLAEVPGVELVVAVVKSPVHCQVLLDEPLDQIALVSTDQVLSEVLLEEPEVPRRQVPLRGSTTERNRAEATAAKAVALTACPAAPVDTFRPSAIPGSRLAGRNSAMMNANMPRLREPTPAQDARPLAVETSFDAI
ncbi:hypothetical protein AB0F93_03300 [Micromonospora tulbaghiae]|uniref:hypothetical protein n=1 Tax=Micromonospora TaxID=1873 RepID=UPI00207C96E8|nr:hypothetical protein [Micromonospora sp. CPM1]MCO1618930.1 hypothetical protein [Micromonospora sp. CPM1]